jgi:hypothetical protein
MKLQYINLIHFFDSFTNEREKSNKDCKNI